MKKWFISKLTQISTWVGMVVAIGALLFPRTFLIVFGVLLFFNPDAWWSAKFVRMRDWLERNWK